MKLVFAQIAECGNEIVAKHLNTPIRVMLDKAGNADQDLPPNPEAGIKKAALGSRFLKDFDKIADQIPGIVAR